MKNDTNGKKAEAFHLRFDAELGGEWARISEYKGSHEPLTARHIPCGEIRTAEARAFFRSGCRKCAREKAYRDRFEKRGAEYIRKIEEEYNVTSLTEYSGARASHKWRCNNCGAEIAKSVESVLMRGDGYGAGIKCECQKPANYAPLIRVLKRHLSYRIRVEEKNIRMREEIMQMCDEYSQNGYDIIHVHDDNQHVTMRHNECGRIYIANKSTMKRRHGCVACSRCGTSYGIQQIEKYLKDNNILFDREVTFPSCKRERVLPFDFAVYDDDCELKCLIEFQGEQHYRATPMFGGEEKLRRIQETDLIKRQWAKDHRINLIIIDWNENISGRMSTAGL